MDGCARGKRSVERMILPRKASGPPVLREDMNKKDVKSVSFCSSRIGCSAKVGPPPVCASSSNGKEIVGSSSRTRTPTPGGFGYLRKQAKGSGKRRFASNLDTDSSETSSVHEGGPAAGEPILPRQNTKRGVMTKVGTSGNRGTIITSSSPQKPDALMCSSVSSSSGSRNGLRCSSVSDHVLSTNSTRTSVKGRNQSSSSGITVSDNRRTRIVVPPTIRGNTVVSISGMRSGNFGRSGRLGAATSRQTPHPPSSSLSVVPSSSHSRPSSRSMMMPSITSPSRSLVSQRERGLSRYSINGIVEVLLALERIEHDQELTYERLACLETNLLSSGMMRLYDEHRDMRLDIDNMSYEELVALGDKMGTVSTALSEEALSKSLHKSIYQETDETDPNSLNKDDDIKCCICQEEYGDGDEVGTMPCEHMYHVSCVQQWLRIKNWCPICKTSADDKSL